MVAVLVDLIQSPAERNLCQCVGCIRKPAALCFAMMVMKTSKMSTCVWETGGAAADDGGAGATVLQYASCLLQIKCTREYGTKDRQPVA